MQHQVIESIDTVWKFHVNPENYTLYLECKRENNEFYLWDYIADKKWDFPSMDKHTTNIIQVQYPYVLLNYLNTDNLIHSSTLACYNLEKEDLDWASSEFKLERCYDGVLQVYNAKISPKRTEFINYEKEILVDPEINEISLDFQFAEFTEGSFQLEYNGISFLVQYNEQRSQLELRALEQGKIVWEYDVDGSDYRAEYDYLMRIANKILFMVDKRQIIIVQ